MYDTILKKYDTKTYLPKVKSTIKGSFCVGIIEVKLLIAIAHLKKNIKHKKRKKS
ncbi:hypothetical protein AFAEC_0684 [Aliarcobacter faecis]|nr:hypothetical protein AFAEC_0684 [Aliarcobacter faecis]